MKAASTHHSFGSPKMRIGRRIIRIGLVKRIDPLKNIPSHVLHSIGARSVWLRADGGWLICVERCGYCIGAITPWPHTLFVRRTPGRSLLPLFFWGQTFARPG